jgi:hypothetical protein
MGKDCFPFTLTHRRPIVTYERIAWLIITGSELDLLTLLYNYNQLQQLHSLLDYECLLFCVTDLVLIYESVTSSSSVVLWLTLHSWTLNFWILLRLNYWTNYEWTELNWTLETITCPFVLWADRTETIISNISSTITCLLVTDTWFSEPLSRNGRLWFLQAYPLPRIYSSASRCLAIDYSGFQASCHVIVNLTCEWSEWSYYYILPGD